jgi:quercetin dioxygenase-like cupin family protein
MIFLVHGGATIAGRALRDGEAWHGEGAATVHAGSTGATCWRFELAAPPAVAAPGVTSRQKLAAALDTLPAGELLLRGDSVAFPPGGCAHPHRHQGPGIRCLIEGGIRIDTGGRSTSYGPGGAWYESGPEPVFAQAAEQPSRFIRVMILPRALLGKSSLQFVDAADAAKPRAQQYKIFADVPIARPFRPTPHTTDADRNCISNIRPEGVAYVDAAITLTHLLRAMRARQISGVRLKDDRLLLDGG